MKSNAKGASVTHLQRCTKMEQQMKIPRQSILISFCLNDFSIKEMTGYWAKRGGKMNGANLGCLLTRHIES